MDGNQEFWCGRPECRKHFTTKYGLKAHMRKHTGERPYQCPESECLKSFRWRSSLVSHLLTHKKAREREKRRSVPDSLYNVSCMHGEALEDAGPSAELSLGSAGDVASESPATDIDGADASTRAAMAAMVSEFRKTHSIEVGPDLSAFSAMPQAFSGTPQQFNASQQFSVSRQPKLEPQPLLFPTTGNDARPARSDSPQQDDAPVPTPF